MSIGDTRSAVIAIPRADTGKIVAGLGLGRARTAIECLDPNPLHQRLYVTTADVDPLPASRPRNIREPARGTPYATCQSVASPPGRRPTPAAAVSRRCHGRCVEPPPLRDRQIALRSIIALR